MKQKGNKAENSADNLESLMDQLEKDPKEEALKRLENKKSAKDFLGQSDADLEQMYSYAFQLYNAGKYDDALLEFRKLIILNSQEPRYNLGIAACLQMKKEYRKAARLYAFCGMMDPDSPIPHFHASDCYTKVKDPLNAIVSLEMAVKRAEGKPEFKTLRDRSLLTIEKLKKELYRSESGDGEKPPKKKKKKKSKEE